MPDDDATLESEIYFGGWRERERKREREVEMSRFKWTTTTRCEIQGERMMMGLFTAVYYTGGRSQMVEDGWDISLLLGAVR